VGDRRLDEHSRRLVEMIKRAFNQFRSHEMSILDLAGTIEGIGAALEVSAGGELIAALNSLVGKLEHIHFMCQPEEQREKVLGEIARVEEILCKS